MAKYHFEIKRGTNGLLKDGRQFNVISVSSVMVCSDGAIKYGDVELTIDGELYIIRIAELIENIQTVGTMNIGS